MPASGDTVLAGGRGVVAVVYDGIKRVFIGRNSGPAGWGLNGYCLMPDEHLPSAPLASDF